MKDLAWENPTMDEDTPEDDRGSAHGRYCDPDADISFQIACDGHSCLA